MTTQKTIYFRFKLWPDREHRKMPDSTLIGADEPEIADLYRFRMGTMLYYRNWMDVWMTYTYINTFALLLIPLAGLIAWTWIASAVTAVIWFLWVRFVNSRRYRLRMLKILITVLFDKKLVPHFGSLLPFEDEETR